MWGPMEILHGTASESLAKKVCDCLFIKPGEMDLKKFNDGEMCPRPIGSVRGKDVFIINSTNSPAENFLETVLLIDAVRRASAQRITLVLPYLCYNRQDRKDRPHTAMSAKAICKILSYSGMNRVLLFDIHSEPTTGYFDEMQVYFDHLYASNTESIAYLKSILPEPFIVASPDHGGTKRAGAYARLLGRRDLVIFDKPRSAPGVIDKNGIKLIGSVRGKHALIVDDMIDTAGSVAACADAAIKAGALSVSVCATHLLASGDAIARLDQSQIKELVVTDTIAHPPEKLLTSRIKITVLSIASLIAKAIRRLHDEESLTELIL